MKKGLTWIGVGVLTGSLCLVHASGGVFSTKSFPVPMMLEKEHLPSTLYFKCSVKHYSTNLESLATQKLSPSETAFVELMLAIQSKNYDLVGKIWTREGDVRTEQDVRQLADFYWEHFDGFQNIHVICQGQIGLRSIFVWDGNMVNGRTGERVRNQVSLAFEKRKDGKFQCIGPFQGAIDVLFVNIIRQSVLHPNAYNASEKINMPFEFEIPTTTMGNTNASPVYFQFKGQKKDSDVFNMDIKHTDPPTRFYQSAYQAFRQNCRVEFPELFTAGSADKMRKWLVGMDDSALSAYRQQVFRKRRVRFVLDADPFYIVFFDEINTSGNIRSDIGYEYLYRESHTDRFRLTNFYYKGPLDDVLGQEDLFIEPVLRRKLFDVNPSNNKSN